MVVKKLSVRNELGLHLRAAAQLARIASKFACRVSVANHNGKADGKSPISLLAIGAAGGTEVTVTVEGKGERTAISEIQELFMNRFGEAQ